MQKRVFLKRAAALSAAVVFAPFALTGCGQSDAPSTAEVPAKTTVNVGVTAGPHADIVTKAAEVAKAQGLTVKVVEFTDYITPDTALNDKQLDIAVYQHEPFLRTFNEQKGTKLEVAAPAVVQPMGFYSKSIHELDAIGDGAKVAIPNDPSNGGRALILLEVAGLIELKKDRKGEAMITDITSNPKNLTVIELEAAQLPLSLTDVDFACIPMNYVVSSGLSPEKDGFYFESMEAPYALIIIAARVDNVKNPEVEAFVKAYRSEPVAAFIEEKFKGTIRPSWK